MTKIDFHILPTTQVAEQLKYLARLVQKALGRNHKVLIAVNSDADAEQVSDALWRAIPESFLAHTFVQQGYYQLQIGTADQCGEHHDVLINLCTTIPDYFSRFERVFEIVCQHQDVLPASRERYRYYSDHGYDISRHDLRTQV
jgi:DNA polymerase III subunit chi